MKKPPPPKTEEAYRKAECETALAYCRAIYPCKTCKWPVVDGYVCQHCGEESPR